ncbi:MAG: adenylyl-sulfate kinase, partial [Pseudomonadota bacterium]
RLAPEGRPALAIDAGAPSAAVDGAARVLSAEPPVENAVLVVDAARGVDETVRRNVKLLAAIGAERAVLLIDGMEEAFFEEEQFDLVRDETAALLDAAGVRLGAAAPIASSAGDLGATAMPWREPRALDAVRKALTPAKPPLRFWVENCERAEGGSRVTGTLASGALRPGDVLLASPSNLPLQARSVDEDGAHVDLKANVFLERGELLSHRERPPVETDAVPARIVWRGSKPLEPGAVLTIATGTLAAPATLETIVGALDGETVEFTPAEAVQPGAVADVVFSLRKLIAVDSADIAPATARFALTSERGEMGAGLVSMRGYADQRGLETRRATNLTPVAAAVTPSARARRNGHKGGVIWLTGLSGSGKSTLAMALEKKLFDRGYFTYVLDGDNVRYGLSADLGFSPEDRAENIRRVGELAALFAQAGVLVVTSFISPYRSDRARARRAAGDAFHEVFVDASIEECERRDPKGLYARARAGEIRDFTGVSAPYEPPKAPEFRVKTEGRPVAACVDDLFAYASGAFHSSED